MVDLTPNSKASDVAGVVEIISHLADSALYEKRLAELRGVQAAAESKLTQVQKLGEKYAMAERMIADATVKLTDHQRRADEIMRREDALASREAEVKRAETDWADQAKKEKADHAARENAIAGKEKEWTRKLSELAARESGLTKREVDVANREARLKDFARSIPE